MFVQNGSNCVVVAMYRASNYLGIRPDINLLKEYEAHAGNRGLILIHAIELANHIFKGYDIHVLCREEVKDKVTGCKISVIPGNQPYIVNAEADAMIIAGTNTNETMIHAEFYRPGERAHTRSLAWILCIGKEVKITTTPAE